jgi:hypothetical protein
MLRYNKNDIKGSIFRGRKPSALCKYSSARSSVRLFGLLTFVLTLLFYKSRSHLNPEFETFNDGIVISFSMIKLCM